MPFSPEASDDKQGELLQRFGCSVSDVLTDPRCLQFSVPGVEGVIPYRVGIRCAVGIGDPVCAPGDADQLVDRFREMVARRGWSTVFASAGEAFADRCVERDYAAIEFGEDLIFDPRRDPSAGKHGHELRKNLHRAERAGVTVSELLTEDPRLEAELVAVAERWLSARRGPQSFITPIALFKERRGQRWFHARSGRGEEGVLSMFRIDAHDGWVIQHLLHSPDAPTGTSESLVTHALRALGREGCSYLSFGPSPLDHLGRVERVSWYGQRVGLAFFAAASRWFHFDSVSHYRRKFGSTRSEPRFLLFHPPKVGILEATGLMRAFNVSLRRSGLP